MENSNLSSVGQINPIQIFKDFKGFYNEVQPIKDTLYKLFIGFYASQENYNLDMSEREDIGYQFNQTIDLITSIGNFDVNEYEASKNIDKEKESLQSSAITQDAKIKHLEARLSDKIELIEILKSKLNQKQNERKIYFNKKTA